MTIEEITDVNFNDISYIKKGSALNQSEYYDVNKFVNEFKNIKYKKISGEYGNTTHIYFVCYDINNEILFTLIDIGNQDKYFIKKGNFNINDDNIKNLYQIVN